MQLFYWKSLLNWDYVSYTSHAVYFLVVQSTPAFEDAYIVYIFHFDWQQEFQISTPYATVCQKHSIHSKNCESSKTIIIKMFTEANLKIKFTWK